MTVDGALARARSLGLERLDAMALLAHHLRRRREWLLAHPDAPVNSIALAEFEADCRRRADDVPLAYLTGRREFHGLDLQVSPGVLVPRPDTETLADWAIARVRALLPSTPRPRVVDLGTGSGALALAIASACPQADVTATDASALALDTASANARRLGLHVGFSLGAWWAAVPGQRFDLAVANPPYIAPADPHLRALRHEPQQALVSQDGGLADLRHIISDARPHLVGWLLLEHGWDQARAVRKLMQDAGFCDVELRQDLQGQARCTGGRLA